MRSLSPARARRPRLLLATLAALVVAVTACGDGDADTPIATTGVATTVPTTSAPTTTLPVTSTAPGTTTTAGSSTTTAGSSTTTPGSTTSALPLGVFEVDADAGVPSTGTVPVGTAVTITIRSATAQEFHLHGYDLELTGTEVTFQFTADVAGTFAVESHDSEQPVFDLVVEG